MENMTEMEQIIEMAKENIFSKCLEDEQAIEAMIEMTIIGMLMS